MSDSSRNPNLTSTTEPAGKRRLWPVETVVSLAVLYISLIALQYTAMPKLAFTVAMQWPIDAYLTNLTRIDWSTIDLILFAIVAGTILVLVFSEVNARGVTRFLNIVFHDRWLSIGLTAITCLVGVRYYFSIGRMTWGGDGSFHTLYAWITSEAFATWTFPIWTPLVSAGTPFLQFYGFTFFYLTGLLNQLVGDLELSIKLVLGIAHAASGLTCYLYMEKATRSRPAGFVAALCYVLSFWHLQQVLIMGRLPVSLIYVLLPLPFYGLECLRQDRFVPPHILAIISCSLGLLFWTHPGYAFWSLLFVCVFALICLVGPTRATWRAVWVTIAGGLLLASYLTLPMLVERSHTNLHANVDLSSDVFPSWQHLLVWSNHRTRLFPFSDTDRHWYGGYLGMVPMAICLYAILARLQSARVVRARDFPLIGLLLSFFMLLAGLVPLLQDLSIVKAMGSSRFLVFVSFFLACTCAIGYEALVSRLNRESTGVVLIALILLDLGTTTIRQPYHFHPNRKVMASISNVYDELMTKQNELPPSQFVPERMFHTNRTVNNLGAKLSRTSTIVGLYHEHPRVDGDFIRPFLEKLQSDLSGPDRDVQSYLSTEKGETANNGLYLLNTGYYSHLRPGNSSVNIDLRLTSPIVVSNVLECPDMPPTPGDGESAFQLIESMGVDPADASCDRIFVTEVELESALPGDPTVRLLSHEAWASETELRFELDMPAHIRFSYGYYPDLDLRLNGAPAEYFRTLDGFIGMTLPAGEHTVRIRGRLSYLRKFMLAMVLLISGLGLWLGGQIPGLSPARRKARGSLQPDGGILR
jgi:hypothetical protein